MEPRNTSSNCLINYNTEDKGEFQPFFSPCYEVNVKLHAENFQPNHIALRLDAPQHRDSNLASN